MRYAFMRYAVMRLDCGHSSPKEPEKIITSEPPNYTVNA